MNPAHEETERNRISALFSRLAEAVGKLVSDHLRLSRLELIDDATAMGSRIGVVAGFSLLIVIGYSLLCAAIAIFAGRWITPAGAWLIVGGINLVAGAIGLKVALARLRLPERVNEMFDEVETQARASVASIASIAAIDGRAKHLQDARGAVH